MTSEDIMIAGAGGQGALLTSRVLGKLVIGVGSDVRLSEMHGMAQCGGSVVALVRYGEKVAEPIVEEGQADVLIASECLEALWYLHFLKKDDVVIVNDWRIDPITVVTGMAQYPEGTIDRLKGTHRTIMVEVMEEAKKMGTPKAFNIIVLGVAVKYMGFEKGDRLKVIETTVPPKMVEINKKASKTGYAPSV